MKWTPVWGRKIWDSLAKHITINITINAPCATACPAAREPSWDDVPIVRTGRVQDSRYGDTQWIQLGRQARLCPGRYRITLEKV